MKEIDKEMRFLLYHDADDDVTVNAAVLNESIWVTQKAMAELFDVGVPAISKHLQNIYEEGELSPAATISKTEIVQTEGTRQVKRNVEFYNLDAIISERKAAAEYDIFNKTQKITSDFDQEVKKMLDKK